MSKIRQANETRRAKIALQVILGVIIAVPAAAQLDGDLALNPDNVGRDFMKYAISGLALFLLFIIFVLIKRKLGGGSEKFEPVIGMTISDVGTLKQKGLLTEEESRAVRAAMARQLTKQLETKNKPLRGAGADALLTDPEIRRLEALAQEKAAAKLARGTGTDIFARGDSDAEDAPMEANREELRRPLDSTPPFTPAVHVLDEMLPPMPELDEPTVPVSVTDSDDADDVQLPQDVLTMAKLGLITPEELENIKARALAKKRELQG